MGHTESASDAIASHLGSSTALLGRADRPDQLDRILQSRGCHQPLEGVAVVLVTEPFLPSLVTRLRHRRRAHAFASEYNELVELARAAGAERLVVCSSAFLYSHDYGRLLGLDSPLDPGPETVGASAAEHAAERFAQLGGRSVVLRLGWLFADNDPLTVAVTSAARKGWRRIEGAPTSWVPAIPAVDAASAVHAALVAPPGTYDVVDRRQVTQGHINATLEAASAASLHPLSDPRWGESGALFGASRRMADSGLGRLPGWAPRGPHLLGHLADSTRRR